MPDLSVSYMGLKLRNPLIVGSSTLTFSPERAKALEASGAAAVVLKSIFEEQIRAEVAQAYTDLEDQMHTEAYEYLRADLPMQLGPEKYLDRLCRIRDACTIPVIASINCVAADQWVSFARKVEASGASGLELNVYDVPDDPAVSGAEVEQRHLDLVSAILGEVKIPVAVKLGPYYSSMLNFAKRLAALRPAALVLFNRFFQPDVDVEALALKSGPNLSCPEDIRLPLRWIAILREYVDCDLSLTTGVHAADGIAKAILAGANAVQICSVLYKQEEDPIPGMLEDLNRWMDSKGYGGIDAFRGLLRNRREGAERGFERAQYVKTLAGME